MISIKSTQLTRQWLSIYEYKTLLTGYYKTNVFIEENRPKHHRLPQTSLRLGITTYLGQCFNGDHFDYSLLIGPIDYGHFQHIQSKINYPASILLHRSSLQPQLLGSRLTGFKLIIHRSDALFLYMNAKK